MYSMLRWKCFPESSCSSWAPRRQLLEYTQLCVFIRETSCMRRSLTLSSTSLVPEESFPPPMATKDPANTQSTAADHLQPQTNSQAPQPVRSDPSRAPK
ncbi:hypothetical protein JOB18_027886 [Solea senegalensis]|nr:hypothetical protein JOB18_027886 [Solea senegalensis]KAG7505276.1 hypothetical protein JOB18_027886 [Solea senegalensis]